ncbi:hypothetical protein [Roseibium litorale]|uniref:hypothetical protein n=1 Tax=Roseibium litorale TaxID=2803841 RepID=UPI001FEB33D4|nr:hypothetical protein [Roseibium litorale]
MIDHPTVPDNDTKSFPGDAACQVSLTVPFCGFNRDGADTNDRLRENFRRIGLQGEGR